MDSSYVPIAIVHHANQYLITNGYQNRTGLAEIIGPPDASSGLRAILDLHAEYEIPFHLHVSGTLIEACAWFDPLFLHEISELQESGLVEIIGSTYAQNIMTLFDSEHNYHQIQEELRLIKNWLSADVNGFWIPERVWNTEKLSRTLTDKNLNNGGFKYTLLDDRLFLPKAKRESFDKQYTFHPELFEAYQIQDGNGLIGLPLSCEMRYNLLIDSEQNEQRLNALIQNLSKAIKDGRDIIAIYGDDMEKVAGIPPWNKDAIEQYRRFLTWLTKKVNVKSVLLNEWLQSITIQPTIPIGTGTYRELEKEFGAGNDYMGWASSAQWLPYQKIFKETWSKLQCLVHNCDNQSPILDLARKHLLACAYETAWHDAPNSIHTDIGNRKNDENIIGTPAPWACTLASHARAAYVLMEAVRWEQASSGNKSIYAYLKDIDDDGHEEIIIRNNNLAAVITPRFGGRIIYMFYFDKINSALLIGNPSDDWNWLEELNDYMDIPINHPGALADAKFEHDAYVTHSILIGKDEAEVEIVNKQKESPAYGLKKRFSLKKDEKQINIKYEHIPTDILPLTIDIGFSPDYLRLLREGRSSVIPYHIGEKRGFRNGKVFTWSSLNSEDSKWEIPRSPIFGHGFLLSVTAYSDEVSLSLGVDKT
ncbi:hypothetical protein V7147_07480 [Bacillus sp. JJ1521]|uniref:hypothetical protein n=1 Tax=Bacillus sp. JJ1521 TaxID=3122957 RepID=UPI002FFE0BC9